MLLTRISSRRLGDTLIDRLQVHKNHSAKDVFFLLGLMLACIGVRLILWNNLTNS